MLDRAIKSVAAGLTIGSVRFRVIATTFGGGGTAMGQHDVFPDGHRVTATDEDKTTTVRFYQTGCFVGLVKPEEIVLVPS